MENNGIWDGLGCEKGNGTFLVFLLKERAPKRACNIIYEIVTTASAFAREWIEMHWINADSLYGLKAIWDIAWGDSPRASRHDHIALKGHREWILALKRMS